MVLSIVIITCNRKKELYQTILSCIEHAIDNMELIIIDNGSTDGTAEAVKEILANSNFKYNYLYQNCNLGVAGGRNLGFEQARGGIVYFIDDDAIIEGPPDSLKMVCDFMSSNPDIGIVATEIFNKQENEWQYGVFAKGKNKLVEGEVLFFIGASHFIRKEPFKDKKLYPSQLFYGAEEHYASLLTWGKGYKVWYTKNLRVIHNPSRNTRLSKHEIDRNNYINLFIVRKLLLPPCFIPISWLFFLLRLYKFCGFKYAAWRECFDLYFKRYDHHFYCPNSLSSVVGLMTKFGIKYLL